MDVSFELEGGFSIPDVSIPLLSAQHEVVGYILPDGRKVRLVVALEVEDNDKYHYVTSEQEMASLGFEALDYRTSEFFQEFPHGG